VLASFLKGGSEDTLSVSQGSSRTKSSQPKARALGRGVERAEVGTPVQQQRPGWARIGKSLFRLLGKSLACLRPLAETPDRGPEAPATGSDPEAGWLPDQAAAVDAAQAHGSARRSLETTEDLDRSGVASPRQRSRCAGRNPGSIAGTAWERPERLRLEPLGPEGATTAPGRGPRPGD
jgi:hypothetical protein